MSKMKEAVASVIWEKCENIRKCARVFGQEICVSVGVCMRLIKRGGSIILQVEAAGRQFELPLAKDCYVIYDAGVGYIELCMEPRGGNAVRLQIKACIHFVDCWDVWGTDVRWLAAEEISDLSILGIKPDKAAGGFLTYEDEFRPAEGACACSGNSGGSQSPGRWMARP